MAVDVLACNVGVLMSLGCAGLVAVFNAGALDMVAEVLKRPCERLRADVGSIVKVQEKRGPGGGVVVLKGQVERWKREV